MNTAPRHARGFTLIELVVTIAIAAILMTVAVPSFVAFQRNAELTSSVNGLLASVSAARTEAMKRNLPAMVTPVGTGWASGWRTFVDVDRNGSFNTGDIPVNVQNAVPSYFSLTGAGTAGGNAPYIGFDGSGYSKNLTASTTPPSANIRFARNDLTGSDLVAQTRFLVLAITGRARVCRPASSSDANCGTASTN